MSRNFCQIYTIDALNNNQAFPCDICTSATYNRFLKEILNVAVQQGDKQIDLLIDFEELQYILLARRYHKHRLVRELSSTPVYC